jgi:hypothetical protein
MKKKSMFQIISQETIHQASSLIPQPSSLIRHLAFLKIKRAHRISCELFFLCHTARYSERSTQCSQHRHDDMYHRLPKFFVLHSIHFFFWKEITINYSEILLRSDTPPQK